MNGCYASTASGARPEGTSLSGITVNLYRVSCIEYSHKYCVKGRSVVSALTRCLISKFLFALRANRQQFDAADIIAHVSIPMHFVARLIRARAGSFQACVRRAPPAQLSQVHFYFPYAIAVSCMIVLVNDFLTGNSDPKNG
jgi:hypothetical protein